MFPTSPAARPPALKFYECECGLRQTWNGGTCRGPSCKRSLVGRPVVEEVDVPRSQDVPPKKPDAADLVAGIAASMSEVFAGVPTPVPNAMRPAQLSQGNGTSELPGLALEKDLGVLCTRLAERGVVQIKNAKPITLPMISRWTPEQRRAAAMWCERMADKPAFLENGVDDDLDLVVIDEEGVPRTRAEMREKHADIDGPQATEIDASAPEMQAVIAPEEPRGRGRRRVVQGGASDTAKSPIDAAIAAFRRDQGRIETVPNEQADTLTVVWGEEKYTLIPGSYSTFTVGPYSMVTMVHPGQSRDEAWDDAYEFLDRRARVDRDRKADEFIRSLSGMKARAGK